MGRDESLEVYGFEAFSVPHSTWPNAWGFRFTSPNKVIVYQEIYRLQKKNVEYATGVDILIHEVYSNAGYETKDEFWKKYHSRNYTSMNRTCRPCK
ncbi:MAG: hypothetical protein GQ564_10005 [Bacteroidales bacterium]|nr:hypothetical protein [Bacteroidales bacterium]